ERADSALDAVADFAERGESLGLASAGLCWIGEAPTELEPRSRWDRTARVADRDHDVPTLADVVDRFASLRGDVDALLGHRPPGAEAASSCMTGPPAGGFTLTCRM